MSRPSSSLGFSLPTSATNDHDLFTMDYLRSFNAARTDEQRFRVAHARLALLRALPTRSERNPKSSTLSRELRVAGNAEFSRDRAAALRRYNESIATAPRGTEELALGYGNRSALYHSTGNYAAALADIGRALGSGGYADHLKTKLYERRAACFKALGRMREAADSLQEAINFLPLARSPRADKLETLTSALRSVGGMADERATLGDQRAAPVKSYGENREIPSASNCLRIAHDPEMGRHIVSTRDIRPGDILVIEKPYASVLTPASYSTHCYNCLKRSDAMIPCQDCTLVMFCSEECRSISWRTFHRLECPILGAALGLDMEHEIKLLALRTLLVACHTSGGLGGLRELVRELQDNTEVRTQDSDPEVTLSPGENAFVEERTQDSDPEVTLSPEENAFIEERTQDSDPEVTLSPGENAFIEERTQDSDPEVTLSPEENAFIEERTQDSDPEVTLWPGENAFIEERTQDSDPEVTLWPGENAFIEERTQDSDPEVTLSPGENAFVEERTQDSDPEVTLSPGENAFVEQGTRGSEPEVTLSPGENASVEQGTRGSEPDVTLSPGENASVEQGTRGSEPEVTLSPGENASVEQRTQDSDPEVTLWPGENASVQQGTQDSDPEVTLSPGENAATEQGTRGSEPDGRYLSSSYTALHWLERHSDNARPPMLNLFAMTAANLVAHLRLSTDLFAGTTGPEADWSVLAGALLMRYMRIAQFNSFRIEEATLSRHGGLRGESYAGGIYNLLSLCNHACWPNAARFFCHGDTKVLFAQLPIKKGEQICVTYAGDFRKLCLSERRKTQLDSFYFECACVACEGDWPVYRHLTSVPVLTCGRCRAQLRARGRRAKTLTCDKCRAKRSVGGLDLAAKRMRDVAAEIDCVRSPPADVTARLVELLEELYESVAMPFLPTVDCQDLISKSFYRTVGNFYVL